MVHILSLPLVLLEFLTLVSFTHAASGGATGLDTIVSTESGTLCIPVPSTITTKQDFRAKIRATPDVCSIHKGFFHLAPRDTVDDYSCSETKPCSNGACCAKTGYCNYGPEACGTNSQSPNDQCWSNCNAHAACGNNSITGDVQCPLNVCCSQYGFCGATSDFCGQGTWSKFTLSSAHHLTLLGCQSNCNQPGSGSSGGNVQSRIIGYYEGWNQNVQCIGMGL